jgi:hypothetical protein
MITNQIINTPGKLVFLWIAVITAFYKLTNNNHRLFAIGTLFIITCYLFNVPFFFALVYLLIATCSSFSEHLVSNMENTWTYKQPDIGNIPYWLIPLWGIVVAITIELYKIISVAHMPI